MAAGSHLSAGATRSRAVLGPDGPHEARTGSALCQCAARGAVRTPPLQLTRPNLTASYPYLATSPGLIRASSRRSARTAQAYNCSLLRPCTRRTISWFKLHRSTPRAGCFGTSLDSHAAARALFLFPPGTCAQRTNS